MTHLVAEMSSKPKGQISPEETLTPRSLKRSGNNHGSVKFQLLTSQKRKQRAMRWGHLVNPT
jgi:hypothetical protein